MTTDEILAAIAANVAALRRPEGAGYPDGRARCLIVADDLERLLVTVHVCGWCKRVFDAKYLPDIKGEFICSDACLLARLGGESTTTERNDDASSS